MKSLPDTEDAKLILQLYELRREPRMRQARDFVSGEFSASGWQELVTKYPFGTDQNAYFRMVCTYWEMVGAFVNRGLINAELFFETTGEFIGVWEKVKLLIPEMRDAFKNPVFMKNFEELAKRYEEYLNQYAPEYLATWREMLKKLAQQRVAQAGRS